MRVVVRIQTARGFVRVIGVGEVEFVSVVCGGGLSGRGIRTSRSAQDFVSKETSEWGIGAYWLLSLLGVKRALSVPRCRTKVTSKVPQHDWVTWLLSDDTRSQVVFRVRLLYYRAVVHVLLDGSRILYRVCIVVGWGRCCASYRLLNRLLAAASCSKAVVGSVVSRELGT